MNKIIIEPPHSDAPAQPSDEAQPPMAEQSPEPAAPVARPNVQGVYPEIAPRTASLTPAPEDSLPVASSNGYSLTAPICGLTSSTGYFLLTQLTKNSKVALTICVVLAIVGLVAAFKNYRDNGELTPSGVIGICASTLTLIFGANLLILQAYTQALLQAL